MQREILFRGKQKNTGDWFYGNLFDKDNSGRTHITTTSIGCLNIDPETVGQYTGMTDKNGKRIFEGDIYSMGEERILYKVVYRAPHFIGNQIGNKSYAGLDYWKDDIEVIGNIHDNKELLK